MERKNCANIFYYNSKMMVLSSIDILYENVFTQTKYVLSMIFNRHIRFLIDVIAQSTITISI